MTSPRLSTYVRIAFVAVAAGVMTACAPVQYYPEPSQYHTPRVVYYDYWYYPAIGSYYDPRTQVYIYYERNHWIRARALPVHVRPHLGRHVVVRSQHDRPYEAYPRHREQYVPERYLKSEPRHRRDDVRIGPTRQTLPSRDSDDLHTDRGDRDRHGKDLRPDSARGSGSVPLQYLMTDPKYPRRRAETRSQDTPRQSEPAVRATPDARGNRIRRQDINQENLGEQYRNRDNRRDETRSDNHKKHLSQQRTRESQETQPPVTVRGRDAAPKKRDLPAVVVPVTQDQGREHEQYIDDKRDRTRDRFESRTDSSQEAHVDTSLRKEQRNQDDRYKGYE